MSLLCLLVMMRGVSPALRAAKDFFKLPSNVKIVAFLSGVSVYLGGLFFLYALALMSKAGAAVIMESWPVLAMFIAPFFIRKKWDKIRLLDWFIVLLCFVGVFLISASEKGQDFASFIADPFFFFKGQQFSEYIGILVAFLAAYCFAFSGVSRAQFMSMLPEKFEEKHFSHRNPLSASTFIYLVSYIIGIPIAFLTLFFLEPDFSASGGSYVPAILNGVILTITSVLYSYALLKADSANINALWYIAPLLAAMWLWLFGLSQITDLIIIGGLLIVISNIILILSQPQQKKDGA